MIQNNGFLYPNLATVHDVGVDGEVRIDQAHLVFKLLGHTLSGSGAHRGWKLNLLFSDVLLVTKRAFQMEIMELVAFFRFKCKFGPLHHVFSQEKNWNSLKPLVTFHVIPLSGRILGFTSNKLAMWLQTSFLGKNEVTPWSS